MRFSAVIRIFSQACIATGIALAYPAVAWAELSDDTTRATARMLGLEGLEAWDHGDLPTALDRLDRAYKILPVPTLALWTGRVLEQMGRLVEASERWRDAGALVVVATGKEREAQLQAQTDAQRAREAMLRRIPQLRIAVEGGMPADAQLSMDGTALSSAVIGTAIPVDPGDHEIQLKWSDRTVTERVHLVEGRNASVLLTSGEKQARTPPAAPKAQQPTATASTIPLQFTRENGRKPSLQATLGWVSLGIGAAGLATWGITGAMTMDRHAKLQDHCPDDRCSEAWQNDLDAFRSYRTASTIGFVVGAVGVGAGAVLLLTAPRDPVRTGSALNWRGWVSPFGIGIGASY